MIILEPNLRFTQNEGLPPNLYIGGVKKIGILLIVAVATQLDQLIHIDSMALRTVTVSVMKSY